MWGPKADCTLLLMGAESYFPQNIMQQCLKMCRVETFGIVPYSTGHHCLPFPPNQLSLFLLSEVQNQVCSPTAIQTIHCKNRTRDRVYHCCCQAAHDAWPPSLFSASVQILNYMLPILTFKKTWLQLVPLHHWFNTTKKIQFFVACTLSQDWFQLQFHFFPQIDSGGPF